jgi:CDP-2,3-bis-(O-geranylgeranyl)-sn-glycerol synthase
MMDLTTTNFFIYFSLAWGANIALNFLYVIKRYFPVFKRFDRSIDWGLRYKGSRLIGDSTTVVGLVISLALCAILYLATSEFMWAVIPAIVYLGDLIGSFIKRRMRKKEGEFVPFIDHGDYMLLLGITFILSGYISFSFAISALLLTYILHPIACLIAFKFKLREHPY